MSDNASEASNAPEQGTVDAGDTNTGAGDGQPEQYPEDHPLVKTLAAQKAKIKDLKVKADQFDSLEDAQKTEQQRAADKVAKAEADIAAVPGMVADALRPHLVELNGFDAEDADVFLTGDTPELLLKQASRLAEVRNRGKTSAATVPTEGNASTAPRGSSEHDFVRELFG